MKHLQVDGQRVNHVLLPGRHNSQTCSITQKQTEKLNLNIKNIMSICHIDIIYINDSLHVNMSHYMLDRLLLPFCNIVMSHWFCIVQQFNLV